MENNEQTPVTDINIINYKLDQALDDLKRLQNKMDDLRESKIPSIQADLVALRTKNALFGSLAGGLSGILLTAGLELLLHLVK